MFARAIRANSRALAASAAASAWITTPSSVQAIQGQHHQYVQCDEGNATSRIRKRATVNKANARMAVKRTCTREELSKIRYQEDEMLKRWEKDEDGWRELPARAWPEYQPNPEQLEGIQVRIEKNGCNNSSQQQQHKPTDICQSLLFNVATALVFYNVDPPAGFDQYEALAKLGHVDSMVGCGVILVEGLGGLRLCNREREGVQWLQQAVAAGSTQALYELGTVYYTGIDNVVEENPEAAFDLFQKAADKGHVGAMYMMADCLIEGEGTTIDVARAVPRLYQAADQGHRYARQRVRELLNDKSYRP